jgi:hypothetical protein
LRVLFKLFNSRGVQARFNTEAGGVNGVRLNELSAALLAKAAAANPHRAFSNIANSGIARELWALAGKREREIARRLGILDKLEGKR